MYIPIPAKEVSIKIHRLIIAFFLFIVYTFDSAKIRIIREISKKYLQVVDAEDAAVADFAALAGGQYLDIAPAAIKIVSQRDAILQVENRAVRLPYMEVDRVTGVEHGASG